ncbi:MAG TPA: hypothetical protein VJ464_22280 [Blastocatellia bacterium]|nr:hypothetical protein [Blastocatellia bacterium]
MTTSNDDSTQERVIFNDDERPLLIRDILNAESPAERREWLAVMLIQLREHLGQHGEGWPQVSRELHRLLEETFKGSETYHLALELYERRFSLTGGGDPAEVLRLFLDQQLSPKDTAEEWPLAVVAQPAARFSPEQYRKRLEVASAAIIGTDPRRIDGMHGCLKADEATLARVVNILEET